MTDKISTHERRVPGLDVLRAVAILLVFLWHFQGSGGISWLAWLTPYGWTGVDLFFVLSGYLIASQLLRPLAVNAAPSLKVFYLKRTFRILPSYLVVLALYFLVPGWNDGHGLAPLWKYLTFTVNFGLNRSIASGFSHAWSLCVEEHFYLVLPSIVTLTWLNRAKISPKLMAILFLIFLSAAGIAVRSWLWLKYVAPVAESVNHKGLNTLYDEIIYYPTYNRLDGLLVGVLIALIFTFKPAVKNRLEKNPNLPALVGATFLTLGVLATSDRTSLLAAALGFPAFALGFGGFVMSGALRHSFMNRYQLPGAQLLAKLAFTFYLTHKAILHLIYPIFKAQRLVQLDAFMLLAVFLICLAAAQLLHMIAEKPFLELRDKILAKTSVTPRPDKADQLNQIRTSAAEKTR